MEEVEELEVKYVRENNFNPNELEGEKLANLKASMKKDGQQQPIIVRVAPTEKGYEIIDGAHRLRIAKELGWDTIKAVVEDLDDHITKRVDAILDKISAWDYAQLDSLDPQYVWRKKNRIFRKEMEEIFALELFLSSGDFSLIEGRISVELYPRSTVAGRHALAKMLETAKFKDCPKCGRKAKEVDYTKKNLQCEGYHDWNPETGKSAQQHFENAVTPKEKKVKSKYPRKQPVSIHAKEAYENAMKKILVLIKRVDSISFVGKDGLAYQFSFDESFISMMKRKSGEEGRSFQFLENEWGEKTGPLVKCPAIGPVDDKMHGELEDWAEWLGGKLLPVPEKKIKAKKKEGLK